MTEADWNACTDPQPMLEFLRGKASERKLRLFACGLAAESAFLDARSRQAVEVAEAVADGLPTACRQEQKLSAKYRRALREQRSVALQLAHDAHGAVVSQVGRDHPCAYAALAAIFAVGPYCVSVGPYLHPQFTHTNLFRESALLRCIFGSFPFRAIAHDPTWRAEPVIKLAEAIYNDRAFDRLPILADALEDAGCTDPDILAHCRGPGPHVRGCWVVDLLTGRQ